MPPSQTACKTGVYDFAMVAGRSAMARVGLVLATLSLVATHSALPAGPRHTHALTVTSAVADAHWNQGWLRPGATVQLRGSVAAPSSLTAALRPVDRPGIVTARGGFKVANAGPFSEQLRLPPRPLPGTYRLRVGGTSGGTTLAPVDVTVTIPAPPEGVLDRAEVGTRPSGPWLLYKSGSPPVVPGSHKELWMRFRFLSLPTGKRIELVWKLHWHTVVARVYRLYKDTLTTSINSGAPLRSGHWSTVLKIDGRKDTLTTSVSSGAPLPSGHWSAVLKVDGRVAKRMDVIVR